MEDACRLSLASLSDMKPKCLADASNLDERVLLCF